MTIVLSLGGSILAPDRPDAEFLGNFTSLLRSELEANPSLRFIVVTGGGGPARQWQAAYRQVGGNSDSALDWIGVMATRLNAQLLKETFSHLCPHDVVIDPEAISVFNGQILVAAGWKPGFSTDYDAVLLAHKFQAPMLINLSNTSQVFTADPALDPHARPIDAMCWADFQKMVGELWTPGAHLPFDPVATRAAAEMHLKVICADGRNLDNLKSILHMEHFIGTIIGPD